MNSKHQTLALLLMVACLPFHSVTARPGDALEASCQVLLGKRIGFETNFATIVASDRGWRMTMVITAPHFGTRKFGTAGDFVRSPEEVPIGSTTVTKVIGYEKGEIRSLQTHTPIIEDGNQVRTKADFPTSIVTYQGPVPRFMSGLEFVWYAYASGKMSKLDWEQRGEWYAIGKDVPAMIEVSDDVRVGVPTRLIATPKESTRSFVREEVICEGRTICAGTAIPTSLRVDRIKRDREGAETRFTRVKVLLLEARKITEPDSYWPEEINQPAIVVDGRDEGLNRPDRFYHVLDGKLPPPGTISVEEMLLVGVYHSSSVSAFPGDDSPV